MATVRPTQFDQRVTLWLTDEQKFKLELMTAREGYNLSEYLRAMIRDALKAYDWSFQEEL